MARATVIGTVLTLLQGCGTLAGNTIFLYYVRPNDAVVVTQRNQLAQVWAPLLRSFEQVDPNARLEMLMFSEREITPELRRRQSRGLGPDLILLSAVQAQELYQQGLVRRLTLPDEIKDDLLPEVLGRVQVPGGYAALPIARTPELACFNRQSMPTAPATLAQLLAQAATGSHVGLSLTPTGIWWTAGSLGADDALQRLVLRRRHDPTPVSARDRQAIERWLRWLAHASTQSHVNVFSDVHELTRGLMARQLDWIPCSSLSLKRLKDALGNDLGVAPLPSGPGGPPSSASPVRVLAFGLNSSPAQRRRAFDLARLSLNPLIQRSLSLSDHEILPVNRHAPPPVASSEVLEALVKSQNHINSDALESLNFSTSEMTRLGRLTDKLLTPMVVNLQSPEATADAIFRELPQP
ncbi:MAG: hypothetical protein K9J72_08155 [Synechococcus sp. Tobar2m-G35]|jgi:arabinogalactan oligomer/maltooligosaccharide transport system substrate-binding protein|nr:hypothetical protein [Synechococcus sp. Tobar2m-G35]